MSTDSNKFEINTVLTKYCDSLERIFIPQSVTFIMENAFDQRKRKNKLTIQAPKGSYAIEYAKKMRFKYEYVEENPIA